MNKHKFLAALLFAGVAFTACKKTDVQQNVPTQTSAATPSSEWKTVSSWSSEKEEQYTVYNSTIEDNSITSAIASDGLVLAYKKSNGVAQVLPFEEKINGGSYFWYYQVSEGSITISADAYGSAKQPSIEGIRYFVLSADKLNELEGKGYSKARLMKLSYENAAALLK